MGSYRSARRQDRAHEFGRRHPYLTGVIVCVALAGVIALCAFQIGYGTYLGRGWLIAVVAGILTATALSAAALISGRRRYSSALGPFVMAWLVLGVLSASAIRLPFPVGPYGRVQAFFNVVHGSLLGYEAVTCTAIVAFLVYVLLRPRRLPGRLEPQPPPVPAAGLHELPDGDTGQVPGRQMPRARGWPEWVLAGAVAGLVAGVILAAISHTHDAASTAAGSIILLALAAVCVAGPAALYRKYRSRQAARYNGISG